LRSSRPAAGGVVWAAVGDFFFQRGRCFSFREGAAEIFREGGGELLFGFFGEVSGGWLQREEKKLVLG